MIQFYEKVVFAHINQQYHIAALHEITPIYICDQVENRQAFLEVEQNIRGAGTISNLRKEQIRTCVASNKREGMQEKK